MNINFGISSRNMFNNKYILNTFEILKEKLPIAERKWCDIKYLLIVILIK